MKRMIITIGRQSGSSGRKVGELLAERLSLPLYGKAELQKIAEGTDDYEEVQAFYEEEPVNSLLYAIAMSQFEQEVGRIPFQRIRELASKRVLHYNRKMRRPYFQRRSGSSPCLYPCRSQDPCAENHGAGRTFRDKGKEISGGYRQQTSFFP